MGVAENISEIRRRMTAAAQATGRDADSIHLIAATKMNDASRVREAIAAGVSICGENRVQEMLSKSVLNAYEGASLHFIGHLQKNKVRQVVGLAELIHGVDSLELMRAIDRAASTRGIVQDILLEVNIGGEESKSGFTPEEVSSALTAASEFSGIRVRGLMAIPPICSSGEENLPYFLRMNKLFIDNGEKKYDNISMDFLSMGMSGDFETAIACGANMIRIGTAIFGPRNYPVSCN